MSETKKHEFKAEIKKLLDILSKSLYKHKEIFLRELISNAVDALRRIHFITLQDKGVTSPDAELRVDISFDEEAKTLTVADTGVGMTREEMVNNLGTIAGSGSQKFLEELTSHRADLAGDAAAKEGEEAPKIDLDLIGQFGVGFYSVFMVADRVRVTSKSYQKDEPAYQWESDGSGEFTVEPAGRTERGTSVTVFLQPDETEYLSAFRLERIVRKYSNFVSFPIYVHKPAPPPGEEEEAEVGEAAGEAAGEAEGEATGDAAGDAAEVEAEPVLEPVNQTEPLWTRDPGEITDEEYKQFYHYVSKRYDDYMDVITYKVDGRVQFRSILFIPETWSRDLLQRDVDYGIALYSKNVMIMEQCEDLIPRWLRFIKGVVESEDVPLNVSRETFQANRVMIKISNLVVKRILREIRKMARKDAEKYAQFWKEYGFFVKEGVVTDAHRREKLMDLLRVKTTKTIEGDDPEATISLKEYVDRMQDDQDQIFYLVGESMDTLKVSPHLGFYAKKGIEVILFDEPIDNFLMMNVPEYKVTVGEGDDAEEKHFTFAPVDVTEEPEAKAEKGKDEEEGEEAEAKDEDELDMLPEDQQKFLKHVKAVLGDKIVDAKMSDRLYGNACRLATPPGGMTSSMQRAMRYWTQSTSGKDFELPRKVLEFNPEHPTVQGLIALNEDSPESPKVSLVVEQLFANCLLAEGDLPSPSSMVPRLDQILEMVVTGKVPPAPAKNASTKDEADESNESGDSE